jgi:formylmethanofuran dehydrogenase subunit E
MGPLDELLQEAEISHGHLCPGQVIGVRMAVLGCTMLGIDEPRSKPWNKRLITFVEIDRCAIDAISMVTGCRLGKRTLKFNDYGIMAATFLRLDTNLAYRILSREDSRDKARLMFPDYAEPSEQQLRAYRMMPDDQLFSVERVYVDLRLWEMPGPPRRHARCSRCGQLIRDGREILEGGEVLCAPCTCRAYFKRSMIVPRIEEADMSCASVDDPTRPS